MALASLHTARTVKVLTVVMAMSLLALGFMHATAIEPGTPEFERTWARTDKPVVDGLVDRTWMWGPEANTGTIEERYEESPGGKRIVQYYDKSRMEITDPDAVDDGVWYVTNGLLVNELISGRIQIGHGLYEVREPAKDINVAGDPNDPDGPTYGTIAKLVDEPPLADGAPITQRILRDGTIFNDESLEDAGVVAAYHVQVTDIDHQVASVFWEFMNSEGTVYEDGDFIDDLLFQNPFYATGYPITEAYWASVKLENVVQDVLIQCFERRCLTYTPGNDEGWQVEAGNVGQHYYRWRYPDPGSATPTSTATTTATTTATATATATQTATATATPDPLPEDRIFVSSISATANPGILAGRAYLFVQPDASGIDYQITVADVANITAVHLRAGSETEPGPIIATLFTASSSVTVLDEFVLAEGTLRAEDLPDSMSIADLAQLMADNGTYVTIETSGQPAVIAIGDVRALTFAGMRANLSGSAVVPPVDSNAFGFATFNYDAATDSIDYRVSLENVPGLLSVHVRAGSATENGPILATLFVTSTPLEDYSGILEGTLDSADLDDISVEELTYQMLTGDAYVSVHSTENATGEIRGQIKVEVLIEKI